LWIALEQAEQPRGQPGSHMTIITCSCVHFINTHHSRSSSSTDFDGRNYPKTHEVNIAVFFILITFFSFSFQMSFAAFSSSLDNARISISLGIVIGLIASFIQSLGLTIQRKSHIINQGLPKHSQRTEHRRPFVAPLGLWRCRFLTTSAF